MRKPLDPPAPASGTSAEQKQPGVLYMLFATEAWERFSYYGMRAILVLYTVKALGFDEGRASRLFGYFMSAVYFTPLIGGFLADRVLGHRRAILIGALVMAAGQFCLAAGSLTLFYTGLGLLVVGNGFFKPNISTIVGGLYGDGDSRRDRAFTIFYMGINLGALLSPFVCGQLLGENPAFGFAWGYRAAGIGMIIGTITFLIGQRWLGTVGLPPARRADAANATSSVATPTPELAPGTPDPAPVAQRAAALLVIVLFVIFFWGAFEQAGTTMTLFADRSTNRTVFGFEAKASLFQSINPVLILLLAPLMSQLWKTLAQAGREPSSPMKMVFGLTFLGFGFLPMVAAATIAGDTGRASSLWLVLAYFLHTVGELCLSPIGLSLVTKLAPKEHTSLFMGCWFLANVAAGFLVSATGSLYPKMPHTQFFGMFFVSSLLAAFVFLLVLKPLRRLMGDVH